MNLAQVIAIPLFVLAVAGLANGISRRGGQPQKPSPLFGGLPGLLWDSRSSDRDYAQLPAVAPPCG